MHTARRDEKLGLSELLAIGVGGMIGGGIFSVLGLAVGISGHGAPLAFLLGGFIALLAGYSYIKLALTFRTDGASYDYLARAFPRSPSVSAVTGWTVIVGYIGTLALYAFTFGAYGAELFNQGGSAPLRIVLSAAVLLVFMVVNLRGVRVSGTTEDIIVYSKIILLALIAIAGIPAIRRENLLPLLDQGLAPVFIAGATLFVAFEGFQLITNAVVETRNPDRDVPRGIYGSILITTTIYLGVAIVAVGSLPPAQMIQAKEYALAVAAEPALGTAGRVLVALAALLATSSAVNATEFGASRMMADMGRDAIMPRVLARRSPHTGVPTVAVIAMTALALALTLLASLETIAAFSSLTFLLVSFAVGVANLRLADRTGASRPLVVLGLAVICITVALVVMHMWTSQRDTLLAVLALYAGIVVAQGLYRRVARAAVSGDAPDRSS